MFYCLDQLITSYHLEGPFLDVGCGNGDLSSYVAAKGWKGKAIDSSDMAVVSASDRLKGFPGVVVEKSLLADVQGSYRTVFLWDILEHIGDDRAALLKVSSLLSTGGHLLASVPSNPREWRWDDVLYGHYRRYTVKDITAELTTAGLETVVLWDFTYPFFWMMRRVYTKLKQAPKMEQIDRGILTGASSKVNAWDVSPLSRFLDRLVVLWWPLCRLQFCLFKNNTTWGHEMFVLARKMCK
jgi:SAM-dependent methyltransferase